MEIWGVLTYYIPQVEDGSNKNDAFQKESPIFQCAMFRFYVKPWQGIIIFLSPGLGWIYSSYTYDCYDPGHICEELRPNFFTRLANEVDGRMRCTMQVIVR